ncbi:MAG: tyrosine recombinase XerC [Thermodesulfovibrionales bacterium]
MHELIKPWEDFERIQRGRSAASVALYVRCVREFVAWLEESGRPASAAEVKREDVEQYLKHLFFLGNSNKTRATKLCALRSFFSFLSSRGLLATDPTAGVPSPRYEQKVPTKFSTESLRKLLGAPDLSTPRGVRDNAMLITLYGAGLRKAELVALDLTDISDTGAHISLVIHGKGGKQRTLLLRRTPAAALRAWLALRSSIPSADKAVFVSLQGAPGRMRPSAVSDVLKKYAALVGIRSADAFAHKLRATWATDLYDAGVGLLEISKLAGWTSLQTAERYVAISERALKKSAVPDARWRDLDRR